MNIKTKVIGHLFGLAALLVAGQVNASLATISLTPLETYVGPGDAFSLTVQGADFDGGTTGGGVILSWDVASIALLSDVTGIKSSLNSNNWSTATLDPALSIVIGAGTLSVDALTFFGPVNFDFFTLEFEAVSPANSGPVGITSSAISDATFGWEGRPVDYTGAEVFVGTVPVPAAAWLFGSGLIGLVGVSRRNKSKQV